MDTLARVAPVARDVLAQVDATLDAVGAPADHPVWGWLRVVGVPPGTAVDYFVNASPGPLWSVAASLRHHRAAVEALDVRQPAWGGAAGAAFQSELTTTVEWLRDGPDSLSEKLAATAAYVDEVAQWFVSSRDAVAVALVEVLGCAQVVAVRRGAVHRGVVHRGVVRRAADGAGPAAVVMDSSVVTAAADIGAHVLAAAARAKENGEYLWRRWSPLVAESGRRHRMTHDGESDVDVIDVR